MFTPSKGVDCFCLFLITGLPEPSLTDKYKASLRSFCLTHKINYHGHYYYFRNCHNWLDTYSIHILGYYLRDCFGYHIVFLNVTK